MPINKNDSHSGIVMELLSAYKKNGKIGNTTPKNLEDAVRIANAIAYETKKEDK